MHRSQVEQLEVISSLSAEDAKAQLMESLKDEAKTQAMAYVQNSIEEAKMTAQQEAKNNYQYHSTYRYRRSSGKLCFCF